MNDFLKYAVLLITGVAVVLGMAAPLALGDHYFCNESGTTPGVWSDAGNWENQADCLGSVHTSIPGLNDEVIIPSGKTCAVDISNAQADHLEVDGTLNINAGSAGGGNNRKLTIDSGDSTSIIDGTLNLQGQYSSIVIDGANTTFSGSGKIVGTHNDATFDFSDFDVISEINIEGNMRIVATDNNDEFTNNDIVDANRDGVLLFENCVLHDDFNGGSLWKVSTPTFGGTPILRFNQLTPGIPNSTFLDGEFQIYDGALDVLTPTTTSGKLKHYGGGIKTGPSGTISFSNTFHADTTCPTDPCAE